MSAEIDEAELEDGTKIQPVSVLFPEGSRVPAPPQSEVLLNIPADVRWNRHNVQWQRSHLEGFLRDVPTFNAANNFTSRDILPA